MERDKEDAVRLGSSMLTPSDTDDEGWLAEELAPTCVAEAEEYGGGLCDIGEAVGSDKEGDAAVGCETTEDALDPDAALTGLGDCDAVGFATLGDCVPAGDTEDGDALTILPPVDPGRLEDAAASVCVVESCGADAEPSGAERDELTESAVAEDGAGSVVALEDTAELEVSFVPTITRVTCVVYAKSAPLSRRESPLELIFWRPGSAVMA